jgi:hypothetical protein
MPRTARCLCNAVELEVDTDAGLLINCHCRSCRRAHGAAFVTTTPVRDEAVRVVRGEDAIGRHVGRFFCAHCASRLFNRSDDHPGVTMIVVSCLDEEPTGAPAMHLNLESAAPWYEILDDAPRYDGFAPGMQPKRRDGDEDA